MGERDQQQALRTVLREAGLRATPARLAVLRQLQHADAPLSHAEVVAELEGEAWDPATVFRTLVTLVEAGFVRRSDVGDHVWRFELLSDEAEADASGHDHAHFLCTECGEVTCVDQLEITLPRGSRVPRSVRSRQVQIQLQGRCDDCV